MVELAIATLVMSLMVTAMLSLTMATLRFQRRVVERGHLKLEARRATARIFHFAAGGYHIRPDNRGLTFRQGGQVSWRSDRLLLSGRPLSDQPVSDFIAFRREGRLCLTLVIRGERFEFQSEARP